MSDLFLQEVLSGLGLSQVLGSLEENDDASDGDDEEDSDLIDAFANARIG